ncbi:MAG: OmpA family protein [Planctomycetes bacterium]|nr:OmpA family protein [Planctomycetota bacterium]
MQKTWLVKVLVLMLVVVMTQGCMVRLSDYKALQVKHADAVAMNEGYQEEAAAAQAELERLQAEFDNVAAQLDDKTAKSDDLATTELKGIWAEMKALAVGRKDMTWIPDGHKLLVSVEFDLGRAAVKPSGKSAIKQIAGVIKGLPSGYIVCVDGHTDSLPVKNPRTIQMFKNNRGLSAARAGAVCRVLGEGGVPPKLMISRGFGQYYPIGPNNSPATRAKNRRVEISVLPASLALNPTARLASESDIVVTK